MLLVAFRVSASEITLACLELLLVDLAPCIPLTQDFQRFVASLATPLPREPPHAEDEPRDDSPQNTSIISIITRPPAPHMNIIGCMPHYHSQVRSCASAEAGASRTSARVPRSAVVCICSAFLPA
jgi:hypothetical protein